MRIVVPLALSALSLGCATKSLPPGTPPPEYEQRSFDPWPPPGTDAGSDAAPEPAPVTEPAASTPPPAPLESDAGPTDAGP